MNCPVCRSLSATLLGAVGEGRSILSGGGSDSVLAVSSARGSYWTASTADGDSSPSAPKTKLDQKAEPKIVAPRHLRMKCGMFASLYTHGRHPWRQPK